MGVLLMRNHQGDVQCGWLIEYDTTHDWLVFVTLSFLFAVCDKVILVENIPKIKTFTDIGVGFQVSVIYDGLHATRSPIQ